MARIVRRERLTELYEAILSLKDADEYDLYGEVTA